MGILVKSARLLFAGLFAGLFAAAAHAGEINFHRDISPILSNNCIECHGPDEAARKAGLRLDQREYAVADLGGHAAVVPGNPDASTLLQRILSADPSERMPPPKMEKTLTEEQVGLLRQWIAEGADWPKHWAFAPPARPQVPAVQTPGWVRNAVDAFVLARLEKEGLQPSPQADPLTLLRRMHLDITGLPPTLEEIVRFESRDPEVALQASMEALLASPHYGERWARVWLDAAQFADSDGFEKDKPREVWVWRDWVINAFNRNMPYDEFVRQQIAGDLYPNANRDTTVATGFLRNSMINEEGGIDPEQFRMEAIFNRADVIGRAVLGLTVQCAQCHTHKYDPLTHTDYFRMLAYINNANEAQMTVYSDDEERRRSEVRARVAEAEDAIRQKNPDWQSRLAQWASEARAQPRPQWHALELVFDDSSAGGQKCLPVGDGSYLAQGYAPTRFHPKMSGPSPLRTITAVRLDLLTDPNLPRGGPGRSMYGTGALTEFEFRMAPADAAFDTFDQWQRVEIAGAIADVNPPPQPLGPEYPDRDGKRRAETGPIKFALDGNLETAWDLNAGPGRSNVPRFAIFTLAAPLEVPEGMQLGVKLIQNHGGWNSDDNQNNNLGRFKVSVTNAAALPSEPLPDDLLAILDKNDTERTAPEADWLFRFWREQQLVFAFDNLAIEKIWREHPTGATQLVYNERATPRQTHRLDRGDFLSPKEPVEPGTPDFLNPLPAGAPPNRLGLAAWLTARDAPTTARVAVNRMWQHYFGTGIVATTSDFGLQGDPPSHPELLDWLALEFMDSGWDMKALQRLILTSATYRQSSRATPELLERDPDNRLLARGSRFRVDGEIVRDVVLAASGLLNPAVGGPSVHPPAPRFLFEPPASYGPKPWLTTEENSYRRGLYTFRFRSVPYPALQVFDAPPGDAPCTRRNRSNTPLQALTTLNEPTFVAAAKSLAKRALAEGGDTDDAKLAYAFRLCAVRAPEAEELSVLQDFLAKQRTRVAAGEIVPAALLETPEGETADPELAAWTLAARVILNLDETITRQ